MILYIPSPAAEPLSQTMWNLSRPPGVRQEGETEYLFGWLDDLQGNRWLRVDTEFAINVHPEAVLDGIADILLPYVGQGITQADIDALEALVLAQRGSTLVVYEAFPQMFKDAARSYAQLIAAGLLPDPQP